MRTADCVVLMPCLFSILQTTSDDFTMEEGHVQPFRVSYKYDDIKLEAIELPEALNLGDLLHKI